MEELGWRRPLETSEEAALSAKRQQIDALDQTIAELLKNRLELAKEIGGLKAKRQIPVKDGAREQIVLDHVRSVVEDPTLAEAVVRVYERLLHESREVQDKPKPAEVPGKVYFPRVLIVGCGLIGGALARQIKAKSPSTVIIGCDAPSVLDLAKGKGVIDEAVTDCATAVKKASLIILAASPKQNMELLKTIAPLTKRRQIVIDVTSTKKEICDLALGVNLKADFVGGHPFFGSQKSGFDASAEIVVEGKTFILVPTKNSSELTVRRLSRWLEQLGMLVQQTDARTHDSTVADTSHAVQLLAVALGAQIANGQDEQQLKERLAMSGPGLRTLARLMGSPYGMWSEILQQNRGSIAASLLSLEGRLKLMRCAVEGNQMDVIQAQFASAARTLSGLNAAAGAPQAAQPDER